MHKCDWRFLFWVGICTIWKNKKFDVFSQCICFIPIALRSKARFNAWDGIESQRNKDKNQLQTNTRKAKSQNMFEKQNIGRGTLSSAEESAETFAYLGTLEKATWWPWAGLSSCLSMIFPEGRDNPSSPNNSTCQMTRITLNDEREAASIATSHSSINKSRLVDSPEIPRSRKWDFEIWKSP